MRYTTKALNVMSKDSTKSPLAQCTLAPLTSATAAAKSLNATAHTGAKKAYLGAVFAR